jgi:hypothetical protein
LQIIKHDLPSDMKKRKEKNLSFWLRRGSTSRQSKEALKMRASKVYGVIDY